MAQLEQEESRILSAYAKRDASGRPALYAWHRPDMAYMAYRKNVVWALAFQAAGLANLASLQILDVGCGTGAWLRGCMEWGAAPERLHGLDLLEDRIARARALSPPAVDFKIGTACELDYPDGSFDLGAASTVFSSVLKPEARLALSREMARVVRPGGWVMIFDFAVSDPRNPDTMGIGKKEISRLFPGLKLLRTYRLIFPPPLLRLIPARLLGLAHLLESIMPLICTHRLYVLQKRP